MPVKFAYFYCLSNAVIGDLHKIGVVNVPVNDKRRLSEILEEVTGDTWRFEFAKFIHHPQNIGDTLQSLLKMHYPVVERNIFNITLDDAKLHFDIIRGEYVHLAHCKRIGF